jgi:hypothetical protein
MQRNSKFYSSFLLTTLMFGAFACGGGGSGGEGDGESFTVNGLWSVSGTSTSGTPNPDSDVCKSVAEIVGKLPPTALNVSSQDGTVTATEVGSDFAFTGSVDDSNQSFRLNSTTPMCQTSGSCTVCASVGVDFLNAAGNNANVNVAFGASGNAACPGQCTIAFQTTGTRS